MLPSVKDIIEVELGKHKFKFRRLTWRDTIGHPRNREELLAAALVTVSSKNMGYHESLKLISGLPIPIQERLHVIYIGSQDERRLLTVSPTWSAPDAVDYQEMINKEEAQKDKDADEASAAFATRYGQEALEEEQALSNKILKQTGYKGAILKTKAEVEELI